MHFCSVSLILCGLSVTVEATCNNDKIEKKGKQIDFILCLALVKVVSLTPLVFWQSLEK